MSNEGAAEGKKFTFTSEENGQYYVYVTNKKVEKVTAAMGEKSKTFDNVDLVSVSTPSTVSFQPLSLGMLVYMVPAVNEKNKKKIGKNRKNSRKM